MDVGSRRRPQGLSARRHVLALTLLMAVVGGAGERPRGDGAGAVAIAAASRPPRLKAEDVGPCQAAALTVAPPEPGATVDALMTAPLCMAVRAVAPRSR